MPGCAQLPSLNIRPLPTRCPFHTPPPSLPVTPTHARPRTLQSTTYIAPYPQRPWFQFQYQWWIIELEFCIFALTAFLTLFPKFIPRVRPVALTFLASALVLVMDNINAIW